MKLLLISDIHANADALRSVLDKEWDSDAIYCAGDILDCGPDPCETIALLRERRVRCVLGNHDAYLLNHEGKCELLTHGFTRQNNSRMTEQEYSFLRSLPEKLIFKADGVTYLMQHGFSTSDNERPVDLPQIEAVWKTHAFEADTQSIRCCVFGHTHQCAYVILPGGYAWINPGSLAYRNPVLRDNKYQGAEYAIIHDGNVSLHRLDYDRSWLLERIREISKNDFESELMCFAYGCM